MTKYLLISLGVLLAVIGAAVWMIYRKHSRKERISETPSGYEKHLQIFFEQKAEAWRACMAAESLSRAIRSLQKKLRRDYVQPGGLRSRCLAFLCLMQDETSLKDMDTMRERLINSCLQPMRAHVLEYQAAFAQMRKIDFPITDRDVLSRVGVHEIDENLPASMRRTLTERNIALLRQDAPAPLNVQNGKLYTALCAALDSADMKNLTEGSIAAPDDCRDMLHRVRGDIEFLVSLFGAGHAQGEEEE